MGFGWNFYKNKEFKILQHTGGHHYRKGMDMLHKIILKFGLQFLLFEFSFIFLNLSLSLTHL